MTDKEKVIYLLESNDLTAAQFADSIGIPRSSISHILSGRNRLSMDIARKIVKQFPEITYEWLCDENPTVIKSNGFSHPKAAYSQPVVNEMQPQVKSSDFARKNGVGQRPDLAYSQAHEKASFENKHVVKMIVFYSDQTWQEVF
ncbi:MULTISPECIES: helix-turn-helix transcriptional regulator [unclassified Siphonobacter]|uniref:helix-turn-helix domain-containing protein n=1 Tax=unclassified Siphonobacter TaxID=2635712 RepID=UPI0027825F10|nr:MULTISPECIES: helix-turn-helix transcriptional regulator [unclassified Siphonobacter]MDQ1089074.1 transcriptional regulator with XRE-family HTH domain [Siphonobacter sp. SORGH_AS_1065]MDR6195249.1 transcriptional regulator with XRE-family HTH domain [Siphonobacter sp. SORGH_AS_0500]